MIRIIMPVLFMAVWVCVGCEHSTPPLTEPEKQLVRDVLREAELRPDGPRYGAAQHALDEIKGNKHAVTIFIRECAVFKVDIGLYSDACAVRDYKLNADRIATLDAARAAHAARDFDSITAKHIAVSDAIAEEFAKSKRYSDSARAHYALMQEVGMMILRDDLDNPRIEELWLQGQSSGE